jgi:hypothetical protein
MAAQVIHMPPRPTTNNTVMADLQRSLQLRTGVAFDGSIDGFVDALKELGLLGKGLALSSIEWGVTMTGNGRVIADEECDGIEIREGRG